MNDRDEAFLEDVASSIDSWTEEAVQGLDDSASQEARERAAFATLAAAVQTPDQRRAFEFVVRWALTGLAHSVMVTLDGGSRYAERLGSPQLRHGDGEPFVEGLHDWLFDHLGQTGRLP